MTKVWHWCTFVICGCHFGVCNQGEQRINSNYRDMIGRTMLNRPLLLDSMHQNDNRMRQVHQCVPANLITETSWFNNFTVQRYFFSLTNKTMMQRKTMTTGYCSPIINNKQTHTAYFKLTCFVIGNYSKTQHTLTNVSKQACENTNIKIIFTSFKVKDPAADSIYSYNSLAQGST